MLGVVMDWVEASGATPREACAQIALELSECGPCLPPELPPVPAPVAAAASGRNFTAASAQDRHESAAATPWDEPACPSAGPSRVLLLPLVQAYQGSTALETVLMSSARIATLCAARVWQCEGDNVLVRYCASCKWAANDNQLRIGWDYAVALRVWTRFWDLSRPVLLLAMSGLQRSL